MSFMSFEEFIATRKYVDRLANFIDGFDGEEDGFVYLDSCFIGSSRRCQSEIKPPNNWWTNIRNQQFLSVDLTALEILLYEWALANNFDTDRDAQLVTEVASPPCRPIASVAKGNAPGQPSYDDVVLVLRKLIAEIGDDLSGSVFHEAQRLVMSIESGSVQSYLFEQFKQQLPLTTPLIPLVSICGQECKYHIDSVKSLLAVTHDTDEALVARLVQAILVLING